MKSEFREWEMILEKMKSDFDSSFVNIPATLNDKEKYDFLTIQIYQDEYAVQINDLKGLQIKKRIVPIPCENISFHGLAGIQGQVTPIYSLASILNIQAQDKEDFEKENNFIICGNDSKIGLSFFKLGSYHQINKKNIIHQQNTQNRFVSFMGRFHVQGSEEFMVLPILDLSSIIDFVLEKN